MSSLKEDVAAYESLMQQLKVDLAKAADVLSKDYGSGVSHQSSKSIGFVWQPLARFDITTQFDIRTPVFAVNSAVTVLDGKSLHQRFTSITQIIDHYWLQANSLVAVQSGSYGRSVVGEDYGYASEYFRQSGSAVHASGYQKVQVTKADFKSGLAQGVAGRYELTAEESVNIQAAAYLVGRAAKDVVFAADSIKMQAQTNFLVAATGMGQVTTTGALSLSGSVTNVSSLGATKVSATGVLSLDGSVVQINMGGVGIGARTPLNLDALEKLSSLGITEVVATAANITALAAAVSEGNVSGALASVTGLVGSVPGVSESLNKLNGLVNAVTDPVGTILSPVNDLLKTSLPPIAANYISEVLTQGGEALVRQALSGDTSGIAESSWATFAGIVESKGTEILSVQSQKGAAALAGLVSKVTGVGKTPEAAIPVDAASPTESAASAEVGAATTSPTETSALTAETATSPDASTEQPADATGGSLPPPPVVTPVKPYSSPQAPPVFPQQSANQPVRVDLTNKGE